MTIGKKLYVGFGSILGVLVALLLVNVVAGIKESSARKDASTALESVRAIEAVRHQIMLNRLNLNNFLLSGDPRDEEKVTRGLQDVSEIMKRGESQAGSDALRTALIQVEGTETTWADNFAKPLDSGGRNGNNVGRQFCQAPACETPSSGFRGCHRLRSPNFLSAKRSCVLAGKIVGRSRSIQRGYYQGARRLHQVCFTGQLV